VVADYDPPPALEAETIMWLLRWNRPGSLLPLVVLCACAGCAGRPSIQGNVTLDGVPVDGGSISFFQGSGPGSDKGNAPITAGKYVIEGERAQNLTPGSYTVRIFWIQLIGSSRSNPTNADASAPVRQAIPPQYNVNSTLTREIQSGPNKLDFDLQSK
jgi:hypothetical protein